MNEDILLRVKKDHPGVYIPPPVIYAVIFIVGLFLQKQFSINNTFFHSSTAKITGSIFIAVAFIFIASSVGQFIKSRNTVVTIKPASSLQTTGIYSVTRNPMYAGLACVYLALGFLIGNWWNFILFPLLIIIVQTYIIYSEEKYLEREFGAAYSNYKKNVRRWL